MDSSPIPELTVSRRTQRNMDNFSKKMMQLLANMRKLPPIPEGDEDCEPAELSLDENLPITDAVAGCGASEPSGPGPREVLCDKVTAGSAETEFRTDSSPHDTAAVKVATPLADSMLCGKETPLREWTVDEILEAYGAG